MRCGRPRDRRQRPSPPRSRRNRPSPPRSRKKRPRRSEWRLSIGVAARRCQRGRADRLAKPSGSSRRESGINQPSGLRSRVGPVWQFVIRSRPHAVTPNLVSKATAPLPILSLDCEAAMRLGAAGVLIMPEGPMEWELVRSVCAGGVAIFVASSSPRQLEAIRKLGLQAIEVEPSEAAIAERIALALIEAVANDHLKAGARVVVAYSGFEAEALDSLTVIRLGEHLERLTARDLRALETWVPFETLKAVVDTAVEIGREGREGKAVGSLIVVGDVRNVLPRTRPLGFDPFKGYRRKERNVRDPRVREAIK